AQNFDIALGDSEYNRYELEQMGYPNTGVLPLLIDYSIYTSWNHDLCNTYSDDWVNILFVGRISPNKKHEDIIKVFYYYKKIKPKSRLFLPGGYGGCEPYFHSLQTLVQDLQLSDVHFPGKVPIEDLVSYYQVSDIFLCMSEHEGFNVPLVESMYFGVPIIAYNACAIPHTLGDAGILVKSKSYIEIAELINLIVEDQAIRERLISRQRERLKAFDYSKIAAEFYAIIKRFELE
ncbi:glycosyltransferase, partial [Methanosalsum natronophilum]